MKSVSGNIYVATIVIAIVLIGLSMWGGSEVFKSMHGCVVNKTTKKAVCSK